MTRVRRLLLALVPLAVGVLACAGARERLAIAPPAAEREAYAAAVAPLPRDPAGAERRLSEFLQRYPDSSLSDDAGLELGRIALARGDRETALTRFRAVVDGHPDGDRSDSARGDQHLHLFVEVPTRLNKRQRELLEEFAEEGGTEVSPVRKSFLDKLRDLFE